MKRRILNILVIVLTLGIVFELYIYLNNQKENKILESVRINETFKDIKNMISIQIQNEGENDYGWHEAADRNSWPSKDIYTFGGAECTDSEGVTINYHDVLTFDEVNNEATLDTQSTIYCTLYFTKGKPAYNHIKTKSGNQLQTQATFGLYRYKGTKDTITKNYICFGTTDINTCTGSNKQNYMYRIIGATDGSSINTTLGLQTGQLKLIRAVPSTTSIAWNKVKASENDWNNSDVKNYLNNDFLTSEKSKWIGEYWEYLIDTPSWYIGDVSDCSKATTENTSKVSNKIKIGLMYASDYNLSGTNTNGDSKCENWIVNANGLSDSKANNQWTMTRNKWQSSSRYSDESWIVCASYELMGCSPYDYEADGEEADGDLGARPVFFLEEDVKITGEGTESSPYIITSKS